MNFKSKIKTVLITLLIITGTISAYAALSTVVGGDQLSAGSWNAIVNMVNSHDGKLSSWTGVVNLVNGHETKLTNRTSVVNMVNSHETKINALSSNGGLDVIVVDGPTVNCTANGWTASTATCPAGYAATGGGCYGVCLNITHPNSYPVNATSYKCDRRTGTQDHTRTMAAKVYCTKVK